MRAEAIVRALLANAAGVTAIVGGRIYGGVASQDAPAPLLVFRKIGATREEGMDPAAGASAIVRAQVEVTCVAAEYDDLKALGEAVRTALAYQRGTVAGHALLGIFIEAEGPDEYMPDRDQLMQAWTFRIEHDEP